MAIKTDGRRLDQRDTEVSSSHHTLTADRGLSVWQKAQWMALNVKNNLYPSQYIDDGLKILNFSIHNQETVSERKFRANVSPSRRLCDIFWSQIAFPSLRKKLGGSIDAIEIGCGSGMYGEMLNELTDGRISYFGTDIASNGNWDHLSKRYPNFRFRMCEAESIDKYLTSKNFIFTQSALEHFRNDMIFFEKIAEYVNKVEFPVIQIHLVPSTSCIFTYPWHGVRQYSPRTISRITKLFSEESEKVIYNLGSYRSVLFHLANITLPRMFRTWKGDDFESELCEVISKDVSYRYKYRRVAAFHAFCISNQKGVLTELFK